MTGEEFVKLANKVRRDNKGKWYLLIEEVNGELVQMKAYGTWIQILQSKGYKTSGPPDCSVKEFKQFILEAV